MAYRINNKKSRLRNRTFDWHRLAIGLIASLACATISAGCGLKTSDRSVWERASEFNTRAPHGRGQRKIGRPYTINGRTYVPKHEPDYDRIGLASWYGHEFHGRKTANGEVYDQYALSGAHPTLPLPSYVRVTNLENNITRVIRINDRGPFIPGRIIDLSLGAARELKFAKQGTAKVRVEYIGPAQL